MFVLKYKITLCYKWAHHACGRAWQTYTWSPSSCLWCLSWCLITGCKRHNVTIKSDKLQGKIRSSTLFKLHFISNVCVRNTSYDVIEKSVIFLHVFILISPDFSVACTRMAHMDAHAPAGLCNLLFTGPSNARAGFISMPCQVRYFLGALCGTSAQRELCI